MAIPAMREASQDSRAGDRSGLVLTIWERRADAGHSTEQERERVSELSAVSGGVLAWYIQHNES